MSQDLSVAVNPFEPPPKPPPPWVRVLWRAENWLVTLALAAMIVFPLTEVFLRKFFRFGISGVSSIEQHLTLIVGMLGGAIAAREKRLLSLSSLGAFLKGRWKTAAATLSGGAGVAITVFLCIAAWKFVQVEKEAGKILAYQIPIWAIELVLPVGFAVIALRLWWHSQESFRVRGAVLVLAALLVCLCAKPPVAVPKLAAPLLIGIVIATVLGAPIYTMLGGAGLILFWREDVPIAVMAQEHYTQVVNPSLPTIPLFTLAGYFLAESGASKRLVRVFQALFGSLRGGPGIVTALVCAFFTTFTGGSGATILALGGLLMPVLLAARYSERAALGLITGAGSLGLLFPPCLPVILYAIVAGITMKEMFLGGVLPGLLMVVLTAIWAIQQSPKAAEREQEFRLRAVGTALWEAKWELLLPVVALVALFGGFATPVEASAVTALYALLTATVIHRDLHPLKDVPRVMTECGLLVGGILMILGVALGFTHYLVDARVPDNLVEWTTQTVKSKWLFLLGLNVVLLIVGGLVEIYAAIIVVVPLLVPLGAAFGIDPVHLGIIFLANMELGFLAPPVGLNLLLSSYRFKKPMLEVMRSVIPMALVLLVGVLLITYFPPLTTILPRLFK
jgi:C4-dicarboxylate transporter DctM subunit